LDAARELRHGAEFAIKIEITIATAPIKEIKLSHSIEDK
jgi:hypothetical protein